MKLWVDTETVGLVGPCKLIQYSIDDGPVQLIPLYRGWENNADTVVTLKRFFGLMNREDTLLIAYNASFDLLHLYRVQNRLHGYRPDAIVRYVQPFLCRVLDLMIPAMLTSPLAPFAFGRGSNRSVARLRRIPRVAQSIVTDAVTEALLPHIPPEFELKTSEHEVKGKPHLVTLSWFVKGSLALKRLMRHYEVPTIQLEDVWPLPKKEDEKQHLIYPDPKIHNPVETECEAVMRNPESGFWKYAVLDILYLKVLYEKLGQPEPDHHSDCVHVVAYTRFHGFDVDHSRLFKSIEQYRKTVTELEARLPFDLKSPKQRLEALRKLDPLVQSTGKDALEAAVRCGRPCSELAQSILDYGPARQRLLQCEKVAESTTKMAHPNFRVMGTATGRMAGASGLNWQGIGAPDIMTLIDPFEKDTENEADDIDKYLEEQEVQAELRKEEQDEIYGLRASILAPMVGDFASFEVGIAEAVYGDDQLHRDLENSIDLHAMVTALAHPSALREGFSYDDIYDAYKHRKDPTVTSWRKTIKRVVFGMFYFATPRKVAEVLGITLEEAEAVEQKIYDRYPGIERYKHRRETEFMTADVERWSGDCIAKMDTSVTDLTGFSRHWDFEKSVAETMWALGKRRIRTGMGGRVVRSVEKGGQTIDGAIMSALLGSAIAIQAAVMRQAGNMPVQATGANLTKKLMAKLWNSYRLPMMNIHDELVFASNQRFNAEAIGHSIHEFEEEARKIVPFLKFEYAATERWSDK